MGRRGGVKLRKVLPDLSYGSPVVAKLINKIMRNGKKAVAQREVYNALSIIKAKTQEDPLQVLEKALENIKPSMEVRPRRVGGAAYQVPISVKGLRRESLGIRWLVKSALGRSNSEFHTFADKLAAEIIEAFNGGGSAVKKKLEIERIAEANRAFAHFRW